MAEMMKTPLQALHKSHAENIQKFTTTTQSTQHCEDAHPLGHIPFPGRCQVCLSPEHCSQVSCVWLSGMGSCSAAGSQARTQGCAEPSPVK